MAKEQKQHVNKILNNILSGQQTICQNIWILNSEFH